MGDTSQDGLMRAYQQFYLRLQITVEAAQDWLYLINKMFSDEYSKATFASESQSPIKADWMKCFCSASEEFSGDKLASDYQHFHLLLTEAYSDFCKNNPPFQPPIYNAHAAAINILDSVFYDARYGLYAGEVDQPIHYEDLLLLDRQEVGSVVLNVGNLYRGNTHEQLRYLEELGFIIDQEAFHVKRIVHSPGWQFSVLPVSTVQDSPAESTPQTRGRKPNPARDEQIWKAINELGHTREQVAHDFKLTTATAVSKACKRHEERNAQQKQGE